MLRRKILGAQACYRSCGMGETESHPLVGERWVSRRSGTVRTRGGIPSENAGMSSDKEGENPSRRKPKVS